MELWDIYDKDKKRTGRTMERNDWKLKEGEYHLTVLGVVYLIRSRIMLDLIMSFLWVDGKLILLCGKIQCTAGE